MKYVFFITNSIGFLLNLSDIVYYPYVKSRTIFATFKEFQNESNIIEIFAIEAVSNWHLVLLFVFCIVGMFFMWKKTRISPQKVPKNVLITYTTSIAVLLATVFFYVIGLRGGFGTAVRPIHLSNAGYFTKKPQEITLVLNTTFKLVKTITDKEMEKKIFFSEKELKKNLHSTF